MTEFLEREFRENPLHFLTLVKTFDPHSEPPIRPFSILEKPYLQELAQVWVREPLLLVQKSRQMMVSWLFCALYLWDALVHQGCYIFFQSQKEDDAGLASPLSLLSRVKFIAEHLPEVPLMDVTKGPPMIRFPESGSTIHAVSQDSDAFRTYTASGIFADELAFQPHAEQAYSAAKPTLDGGGRYTGVSTPNGKNFFYRMCFDVVE